MKDVLQASTAAHCAVMVGSLFGTYLTCLSLRECGTACPRFGTQSRAKTTPAASFSSRWVDAPAAAGEHPARLPPAARQRWSAVCCLIAWSALLALCCNCHKVWLGQPHTECLALLGPSLLMGAARHSSRLLCRLVALQGQYLGNLAFTLQQQPAPAPQSGDTGTMTLQQAAGPQGACTGAVLQQGCISMHQVPLAWNVHLALLPAASAAAACLCSCSS